MKVVLDTNAIVSAAFFGGPPRTVLDAWTDGHIHVILTPSIFDEYQRARERLRASYPDADYQAVLTELLAHGTLTPDLAGDDYVTADPDDDEFMRCALQAGAVVVSGDRHLLDADGWRDVRVLTPSAPLASMPG